MFCFALLLPASVHPVSAEELRTVAAVRALNVGQTEQNIPVHLQGAVTFFDERLYSHFIQDNTAGIYLQFPTNVGPPALHPAKLGDVPGL
jgi:hypothetical protein